MKRRRSLKLLVAASEAIPYAKTGGLGDVTGALPQELAKLGHDVVVVIPRYRSLDQSGRNFRVVDRIVVSTPSGKNEAVVEEDVVEVSKGARPVRVWALRHDRLFDRIGLYQEGGKDYSDNFERFAWFSRAIVELTVFLHRARGWKSDLVHLHDWQTALAAVYLKITDRGRPELQNIKSVLTLHNVGYQGIFPGDQFGLAGLPPGLFGIDGLEFYHSVNLLKGGIIFADYLTTVSPTYAKEILSAGFGFGLEGVLHNRADKLEGIVNGIDTDRWNPARDQWLPATYSNGRMAGKQVCKQSLQREFGLPEKNIPLLAVVSRLTSQKGIDLIEAVIPDLMQSDLQFIILGTGDPAHEETLRQLQRRYPDRIGLHIGFSEELAHRIEGGADMFVMPSRYEPCGLSQLYSLRYGTVPIVTATGGLADTVVPLDKTTLQDGTATGFHVRAATKAALIEAINTALRTFEQRALWNQMVRTGMKTDVSWSHSARAYDEVFQKVVGGRDEE